MDCSNTTAPSSQLGAADRRRVGFNAIIGKAWWGGQQPRRQRSSSYPPPAPLSCPQPRRIWENKEKWYCSDIEIQKLVLRAIDVFLECISSETLQYPIVKKSLCSHGGEKLLENGERLLQMMVGCMDRLNTCSVRTEAFKLARCLALNRRRCIKMMNICCESLVKAVTSAMNNWSSVSDKFDKSQLSVMEEACRLATITQWAGDHHIYFWKAGMDRLLLDLLLEKCTKIDQLQRGLSVNELIFVVRESYNANPLLSFRPYLWDILGGLAANCAENINHEIHGNELRVNVLIVCACVSFTNSLGTLRQVSRTGITNMNECESTSRAVLMMVYSPCKYISSLARSILCEILKSDANDYVDYLLDILNTGLTGNKFGLPGNLQILVSLMSLACYCSQPTYRKLIIKSQGIKTIVMFVMRWLNSPVRTKRASMVPHLRDSFSEKTCCSPGTEEWEGEDILLLFSLWILAELLHHSTASMEVNPFDNHEDLYEAQLIQKLQEICGDNYSHGSRWYAAYVLSFFRLFGFPSKLGKRIGRSLCKKEYSDLKLDIINEESVFVHEVILTVRCPALLPPGESSPKEKSSCESTVKLDMGRNNIKAVRLSAHVDQQSLLKLLKYVYSGYFQASADLVKKLRVLTRHCKLESLMQMLYRRNPKWGVPVPNFDLRPALGPAGHNFSDLILEAGSTIQLTHWKCSGCGALVQHLHVHKVILESSCEYLRALFQSGMQESHMQSIKVPVGWESLNKLVSWFYSDQLPVPAFDCLWDNLDPEEKFREVESYLELCWLAEFWLLEDLYKECHKIVVSCLDSPNYLSCKVIQVAAKFSQWELAQLAANYLAPSYHHLRSSGELDSLDDSLVEMVRAASVRLAQDGCQRSS
ncbi:hypothetical protein OROMI_022717 [Orobanche minor]